MFPDCEHLPVFDITVLPYMEFYPKNDIPPTGIGSTKVLQTIVNGKVIFDRANSPTDEDTIKTLTGAPRTVTYI